MAARGARSRKVLDKELVKKEKKDTQIRSPFDAWTLSSEGSKRTNSAAVKQSSTSGVKNSRVSIQSSRPSSPSGFSAISHGSHKTDGTKKYAAKGKETAAPRGRGGGVPNKAPPSSNRAPSVVSRELPRRRGDSTGGDGRWPGAQIWYGNSITPQPYRGLDNDMDMWMENGDCYIFFTEESMGDNPRPSLRVHTRRLKKARSTLLNNLLKYSAINKDEDQITPVSPGAGYSSVASRHTTISSTLSAGTDSLQSDDFSQRNPNMWTPRSYSRSPVRGGLRDGLPSLNEPAYSPIGSDGGSSTGRSVKEIEVTHEVWFPAPAFLKTPQAKRRHHLAQRNFIALLYNKPLVGHDFFEMLVELESVIKTFYELDRSQSHKGVQYIVHYLTDRHLDDVRNNWRMALGLLAWSEQDSVRWQAGYMEAFVHCAGMLTPRICESAEFKRLSTVTRYNLNNASTLLKLRVVEAEERLAAFELHEIFPPPKTKNPAGTTHQRSFNAFRDFLIDFYSSTYGSWPPPRQKNGHWLTRDLVIQMQQDFGSAYDFLVDRDVCWEEREERSSRKWQMVTTRPEPDFLAIETAELPLTDMLLSFDNKHSYKHIPHPYPLLPKGAAASAASQPEKKKNIFSAFRKEKPAPQSTKDWKEKLQAAVIYSDASNIHRLGTSFASNDLIDALEKYEKSAQLKAISPQDARIGRWILIYGVLQTLSTLSVDAEGLRFSDSVSYLLCPSLKKCPPWDSLFPQTVWEADQTKSYCWLAPMRWEGLIPPTRALESKLRGLSLPLPPVELDATGNAKRDRNNPNPYSNHNSHLNLHLNTGIHSTASSDYLEVRSPDREYERERERSIERRGMEKKLLDERRMIARYNGRTLPPVPDVPVRSPKRIDDDRRERELEDKERDKVFRGEQGTSWVEEGAIRFV
ncbi:hypothetical protein EJ05DRAFT_103165 [Pseudovirgaria hyperparasitica]|uniref:DUF8004 domain-containing protein n=1 Tax=Pseudovirgaria hyperparasitica TaxID=470096 RepID=A0A6A6W375_9PEZI|nr:uncharacterized protein EJ05DRAFT_103165 [Pseudovirgaria hyperparasitica]KAF2755491.1 hypothetical protein EJ05DRAFT_103165 [Pseudovirgaria hyperparasitica]